MTPPTGGDLGDILKFLEIIAVIGTGLVVVFKVGRAVERFELIGQTQAKEISELKEAIKAIAAAQSASLSDRAIIATQGMQIAEMRQEINQMRRGQGFIRQDINGEWPK